LGPEDFLDLRELLDLAFPELLFLGDLEDFLGDLLGIVSESVLI